MNQSLVKATHNAKDVQKYYSLRASNYDAGSRFEIEHHLEAVSLAGIKQGQKILDAACGTGRATIELAKAVGRTGRVDAVDLTEAMLRQAREKTGKLGLSQVNFQQGNVMALPYPDKTFDLVYNGYMFDLIPVEDFLVILSEFKRVLQPGGKLVLVNMSKPGSGKTFYEKVYEKKWAVMPCRPVLMEPYLKTAGFSNIERRYRHSYGIAGRLWGTEIVTATRA